LPTIEQIIKKAQRFLHPAHPRARVVLNKKILIKNSNPLGRIMDGAKHLRQLITGTDKLT